MQKQILPINPYIIDDLHNVIIDVLSGKKMVGGLNGAEVFHIYEQPYDSDDSDDSDNSGIIDNQKAFSGELTYYNVLLTESMKAKISEVFNSADHGGYPDGPYYVLTHTGNSYSFAWDNLETLVNQYVEIPDQDKGFIRQVELNNHSLPLRDYQSNNENGYIVNIPANEPNYLRVSAPAGEAAYINVGFYQSGATSNPTNTIYYATSPYATTWNLLNSSLNVAGNTYYLKGDVHYSSGYRPLIFVTSGARTIEFSGDITFLIGNGNSDGTYYSGGDKPLSDYQFQNLFSDCLQIVKAPDLPSTTLGHCCYEYMFRGCTSLVQAPTLPATSLAAACYQYMFGGCTSLVQAPALPATSLAGSCYYNMFQGCTSLVQAPDLPATNLEGRCYYGMFYGCSSLVQAPDLPATILASECYRDMFRYCTSLEIAPALPANETASYCYYSMFNGCSKLRYIKALFTQWTGSYPTSYWVSSVSSTGVFVKDANSSMGYCNNSNKDKIPNGWTVYTTNQLITDELPESYIEDCGKILTVDASGLWVKSALPAAASSISYDSSDKIITLLDGSGNAMGTPVDATDFIKDGMVSDVSVYDGDLVISFNTDAGKEDIAIPLTKIFDASSYYTNEEIDTMLEDMAITTAAALNELNERTQDISAYVKREELEEVELATAAALTDLNSKFDNINSLIDVSAFVTKEELEEVELATALGLNDLDTRIEDISDSITDINSSISYISETMYDAFDGIYGHLSSLDSCVHNIETSVGIFVGIVDTSIADISTKIGNINTRINKLDTSFNDISTRLNDISTSINTRITDNEFVTATALADLDDRINDVSARVSEGGSDGGGIADIMTNTTYADLKTLRDTSTLIPGMQYLITDYVTTVGDASLGSAEHAFGVIVTADSSDTLNEDARIIDLDKTYYSSCNLSAYEIKYSLDNDSSRFGWADPDGTGVIWYMKDDSRNAAYYDFTNITFSGKYTFNNNGVDARLASNALIHDNVIGPHYGGYIQAGEQAEHYTISPNNIVFNGMITYNNTFGNDCYDLKFSSPTAFNLFEGAVWDCSFGSTALYNTFKPFNTGHVLPNNLNATEVGTRCMYLNVTCSQTYCRCTILPNTIGTSTSSRLTVPIKQTGQFAGLDSSGELKLWVPADFVK